MLGLVRKAVTLRMPLRLHVRLWRWIARSAVREFPWAFGRLRGDRYLRASSLLGALGSTIGLVAVTLLFADRDHARALLPCRRCGPRRRCATLLPSSRPSAGKDGPISAQQRALPAADALAARRSARAGGEFARVEGHRPPARRVSAAGRHVAATSRRDPGARRRVDRRQPHRAGDPAAQPSRRQRLGRASTSTTG